MSHTFHLLMLLHLVVFSFALPSSIEVDLIFPRNDTVYKPVWPFPIVFAVRNASQLWQSDDEFFDFWVKWELTGYTDINDSDTSLLFSSGVWKTDKNATTDNTFTIIDASRRDLVSATQRQFQLKYTTTMFAGCPINATSEGADSKPQDVSHDGRVVFTTDPDAGQIPAIAGPADECPAFVGSFEITDARHDWGTLCPVVSRDSPASQACNLKMDEALANEVSGAMLDRANCPRGTWPDPEGKLSRRSCNAKSSSAGANTLGVPVSALVLILAVSWALV
ncbi:hypothetical protein LZ30DRAFT_785048 [Colletotrichum cereale]|nr:hypothetical protein LZ30DRAFT_785048 [Colletotrichum cereale]